MNDTSVYPRLSFFGKIQDKDDDYYSQFQIIICGLDSVEARRWMNATIVNMYDPDEPETMKPMIDGGTEGERAPLFSSNPLTLQADSISKTGFKGQSRIIFPRITSCYECSLDMHAQRNAFPICTIANTPRLPEHCIEFASVIQWPKDFPGMWDIRTNHLRNDLTFCGFQKRKLMATTRSTSPGCSTPH
jgi:ubiquitin-activating enzyme E1 C